MRERCRRRGHEWRTATGAGGGLRFDADDVQRRVATEAFVDNEVTWQPSTHNNSLNHLEMPIIDTKTCIDRKMGKET